MKTIQMLPAFRMAILAGLLFCAMRPCAQTPAAGFKIVNAFPHDPGAFTQGLAIDRGELFEGTGRNGKSALRRVDLTTGKVLQERALPSEFFGEGIAIIGGRIFQLTWQSNIGFVYDRTTFEMLDAFAYPGEGWGLAYDGTRLIMSDGTPALRFMDPKTLAFTGEKAIHDQGAPLNDINELEYINGELWANIWMADRIARIDVERGEVAGWIDLTGLLPAEDRTNGVDVLNGIAYDHEADKIYVTGKLWPKIFEIKIAPGVSTIPEWNRYGRPERQ